MKNRVNVISILVLLITSACGTREAKPIAYGEAACHFCKMTIVDAIHGAEVITDKGRIYTFDALECMIHYMKDVETDQDFRLFTNYYESPGELLPVSEATFLISENLPSPMGANLTAFKDSAMARRIQTEQSGSLYSWKELWRRAAENENALIP
ncbi:nitrous oxide reductase accessory protein NosL [Robertkochia aurantiaca]|uniref:nitrous oxide reductase accessory protein NosL n=1 Tax=Robertkochia aurantiaca TaxID=2873700 RepID=UPI001CCA9848|nr:nitrous oxide reductase accessory protein NosL [Robertkochia sp. 3YJGBD-33]